MNATIMRLAARGLMGQRRWFILVALPLLVIALAGAVRALTGEPVAPQLVLYPVGMVLMLPLVSLLAANGVLSPEIDDGSVVYLLSTPVSRYAVALSKYAIAALVTVLLGGMGLVGGAWAAGLDTQWLLAGAAYALIGGLLYTAIFTALSAATRHGMVAGLLYILIVEGALGSLLSGIRYVSVGAIGQRLVESLSEVDLQAGDMGLTYATIAAAIILIGGVLAAGYRLSRFQLRGDE